MVPKKKLSLLDIQVRLHHQTNILTALRQSKSYYEQEPSNLFANKPRLVMHTLGAKDTGVGVSVVLGNGLVVGGDVVPARKAVCRAYHALMRRTT